ncbi:MAG: PTS sugar transporter subunit IIB [Candidatus Firestonebacteria bacterium]|nr:PTS sugar transporter subunit IIB [Candidatus Firestonebacteria bacterium]
MAANLVLVRIDDRLIHGQVVVGWAKVVMPDFIAVANDAVADDALQRSLMELATPAHLGLVIGRVAEIAAACRRAPLEGKRVLLLFSTPQDLLRAVESGLPVTRADVGGMRFSQGKRQVLRAVSLDAADESCFRSLLKKGIQIKVRMVPTDEDADIAGFLLPERNDSLPG